MDRELKPSRKTKRQLRLPGTLASTLAAFFILASPALFAADKTVSIPQWRMHGGAHILLAANKTSGIRRPSKNFDHLLTGFPLFGAHVNVDCGECHIHGILRGTPTRCDQCHGHPGQRATSYKPANHIQTTQPCDQCHNENVWAGSKFDHSAVAPGTCAVCHNGGKAMGKPSGHVATTAPCDECHRTTGWIPAQFKHTNVAPGTCSTCHGKTATGKPSGHVSTTEECDKCHHSTTSWLPADYDHTGVVPGTCTSCHGVWATGKPGDHIPASMSCDACHGTTTFTTSTMRNHDASQGVVPGGCWLCHSGAYTSQGARGKPRDHPTTTPSNESCDDCHSTSTFSK